MSLKVNVFSGNADFCTDLNTGPAGTGCHIPLNKIVWGDKNSSYRVNETYPLPVQLMAVTGESLVVSGNLGASGNFPIVNVPLGGTGGGIEFLAVAGSTSGDLIGVTIPAQISVTGPRDPLAYTTDSVTVHGTVGISSGTLNLSAATDKVSVFGYDGNRYVNTSLYASDGTTIGNSGDAINVNLVNTGTTFTFNANATVGVTNDTNDPAGALNIKGVSGGEPISVKGRNGEAIEVTNSPGDAVEITADYFTDGTQKTIVTEINRPSTFITGSLLVAQGSTSSQLPTASLKTGITIKSNPVNTDVIYVGDAGASLGATTEAYVLESGESVFLEINNTNLVYLFGVSGDIRRVNYLGS